MLDKKFVRTNLHPALMLSFLIAGVTGILLLLHLDVRGIKHLHEWMSTIFLLLCVVHLFLNWKIFQIQFQKGPVLATVLGIGLLSILLLFNAGGQGKHGYGGRSGAGHSRHFNTYR
ncbi:DUF4405 domain-containing protein [Desulfobulbus rhabdoformis]|uniref:DUF4405 domain-containing protein n=1 Tax=Desulfobulbus rhabdoformis TaxID=34032 RepID=UPI0019652CC6|nr:DUF4405 domain-containing protein [Desulfobulbus rhabdoformis]MBM9616863.1 DUF4405 domain-containing protein [Desulfobulbus rhabdoformis]